METDGRQAKPGGTEIEDEDNVVRFPRDWIGPREELIPFGPSAEAEDRLATPPSTHDFWGEPAEALWESDSDSTRATPPPRPPSRHARFDKARSDRLTRARARGRAHRRAAWMVSAAAAGLAALVLGLGAGGSGHRPASVTLSRHAPAATATAVASLNPGRLLASKAHSLATRPTRIEPLRARAQRRSVHGGARHVTRAATVHSVRYSAAPSSGAAATGASSAPAAPPAPAAGSAQASTARSSGSTNQPTLGAAGALAPGSSPDS